VLTSTRLEVGFAGTQEAGLFLSVAVARFMKDLWLVFAALAGHGAFDFSHHVSFR
jgi:hypothetical protein